MESWKEVSKRYDSLNLKKFHFKTTGKYEIPLIRKNKVKINTLTPFGTKNFNGTAHFYLYDRLFERIWNKPKKYVNMLKKYDNILSPDFSPYDDYPLTIQLFNIYRNRWCGAYYQNQGIKVIPTITWSGRRSFEFAFEGVERGSTVSISTVGLWWEKEYMKLFDEGYENLLETIQPTEIIGYGKPIEGLDGNITWFKSYADEHLRGL